MNFLKNSGFRGIDKNKYQVLLVCTGNTCRTPMAEGILKARLAEQGAQMVHVKSAGIGAMDGMPASFIGVSVSRMHNVNIMHHRSQQVTKKLMDKSDLVLVMAENHMNYMHEKFPQHLHKVHLLKNFGNDDPPEDPNVFDPIGSDAEIYEEVFLGLEVEMDRITSMLINSSMDKMG